MVKIGDKVRFLHEVGGGRVTALKGKNIVLVEDEDGFEIPMLSTDVVVIGNEDYSTTNVVNAKAAMQRQASDGRSIKAMLREGVDDAEPEGADDEDEVDFSKVTFRAPAEERKGGNQLSAWLAFVPIDIREVTHTRFETYFVNDSNYYIQWTYLVAEGNSWTLRARGEAEPNTKEFIEEFGREELNNLQRVAVQMLAYKRDKPFVLKPTMDVQLRIDGTKFYKLHTFEENDFFEQKALLYTLVEHDRVARPLVIDAQQLKEQMYRQTEADKAASALPADHTRVLACRRATCSTTRWTSSARPWLSTRTSAASASSSSTERARECSGEPSSVISLTATRATPIRTLRSRSMATEPPR